MLFGRSVENRKGTTTITHAVVQLFMPIVKLSLKPTKKLPGLRTSAIIGLVRAMELTTDFDFFPSTSYTAASLRY